MSIINTNGQPVTTEDQTKQQQQRQGISPAEMQKIIGAYAQLKQLNSSTILSPNDQAIQKGLLDFLTGAMLANAEELFGSWVAIHQEYTPLIQGVTALLNRALARIDAQNRKVEEAPAAK